MIAIIGGGSSIAHEFVRSLPPRESVTFWRLGNGQPINADRYLFCCGLLTGKRIVDQTDIEIAEAFRVNFAGIVQACEEIFAENDGARICVVGSESGISGSYDAAYAGAKAALHRYVETKRLRPGQQLICVAPSIIEDAGMTTRRKDTEVLEFKRQHHPKGRFLRAVEVARLVHHVLYVDEGYLTGTVIRMHGGA